MSSSYATQSLLTGGAASLGMGIIYVRMGSCKLSYFCTHRSILLLLKSSLVALNSCDKQLRGSPRANILRRVYSRP